MQKPIAPNTTKSLVEASGHPSRLMQLLLSILTQNSVPVTNDGTTGALTSAAVLLPDAAVIPQGWQQIDTLVIGANTYKVIALI